MHWNENYQLSLTLPSSSPRSDSKDFLAIFKTLLESAGQTTAAFPALSSVADAEKWISQATSAAVSASEGSEPLDVKALDEQLKTRTYVAGASSLSAADVAIYGALAGYMVSSAQRICRSVANASAYDRDKSQTSHDQRLAIPSVTRHFDLLQNTPKIAAAVQKLSPNVLPHEPVKIDVDNVPLIERKYESSKKDKKEKAAAAATGTEGEAAPSENGKKSKKDKVAAKAAAAMEADSGLAAGTIVEQTKADGSEALAQNGQKKEKKAKKEGAAAPAEGKPKKEKSGGGASAVPDLITPGLVDMRVGHIIDSEAEPPRYTRSRSLMYFY